MSEKFTPGDWRISPNASDAIISDKPTEGAIYTQDCVKYYGGYVIAESVSPGDRNLLRSAKDLYAACESIIGSFAYSEANEPEWFKKCRLALKKARGE